jgi:hypothetical protein
VKNYTTDYPILQLLIQLGTTLIMLYLNFSTVYSRYNVHFQARHIADTKNILADNFSRLQVQQSHQLAPSAYQLPVPVPVLPVLPHYKPH